jgi:hypothetical protein
LHQKPPSLSISMVGNLFSPCRNPFICRKSSTDLPQAIQKLRLLKTPPKPAHTVCSFVIFILQISQISIFISYCNYANVCLNHTYSMIPVNVAKALFYAVFTPHFSPHLSPLAIPQRETEGPAHRVPPSQFPVHRHS